LHPFVNVGLARQSLDVSDFGTRTVGLDFPVAFGNTLWLENDSDPGGFAHEAEYAPSALARKPQYGLPYSPDVN
jgi:hypothetical protein